MMEETTAVISTLSALLDMDTEAILAQSLRGFVAEQMAQLQQRISQLSVEHQRFRRKYGMPWEAFMRALETLDDQPEEDATLHGVPLLEAMADSRWWAHVQEDLAAATVKLEQLQALHK